ncbi:MAG: SDR family NAD(P)-dependent oxidoreductase [Clostridia bacterium]
MNKKKSILVTGAGTGLGKKASIALAKRGHNVYATTRYEKEALILNKIARENKLSIKSFKLDILLAKDREKILEFDFDIIINNAAIGDSGSVSEVRVDRFKNVFETNVFSNICITQIAIKKFITKKQGRIIFISSLFGRISYPFLCPYCASKFAIESLATSLRIEMKKLDYANIEVGIIEPGAYATGFNKENNEKKYSWMKQKSYFKYKLETIKQTEEKVFNFIEQKNYSSIIHQYIKAVEDKKLKHRYSAPKLQAFFIQLLRIFGM